MAQQPAAHELAVQVQTPLAQSCPLAQYRQALPALPHAVRLVLVTHLPPASQQPLQLAALQFVESGVQPPSLQDSVPLQIRQATPPLPQPISDDPGTQLPLASQQPVQLAEPQGMGAQVCLVASQRLPLLQSLHSAPPVPQRVSVSEWQVPA